MLYKSKTTKNKIFLDFLLLFKRWVFLSLRRLASSVFNVEIKKIKHPYENIEPLALSYHYPLTGARIALKKKYGIIGYFYMMDGMNGYLHPFIYALKKYHITDDISKVIDALKDYSNSVRIKSVHDFIGVNLKSLPALSHPEDVFFPWVKYNKDALMNGNLAENIIYGYHSYESIATPPLSDKKIDVETKRLIGVYRSIKKNGYDIKKSIEADLLIRGDEYSWVIIHGHHRAAALEAIGAPDKIVVKIRNIIRIDEAKYWPEVKSGVFTIEEAIKVFCNVFDAIPPESNKKWIDRFD